MPSRRLRRLTQLACWLLLSAWLGVLCASAQPHVDRDGNGLGDVWEQVHGRGLAPTADSDGDGQSNVDEARAGTDPRSARSALRMGLSGDPRSGPLRASWSGVAGKRYRVEVSPDLITWQTAGPSWLSSGGQHDEDLDLANLYPGSGLLLSRWTGLTNGDASTIRTYAQTGTPLPSTTVTIETAETPQTAPDASNFGQWLRGWILPPTTGLYTFWVASDDQSELWLSTDASPANRRRIAQVSTWTNFRNWTSFAEQRSAPIQLEAGRPYYIEAFQREWSGGDHLSLAWAPPGTSTPTVIAAPYLTTSGTSVQAQLGSGRLFLRLVASDVDSDGDGVNDYEERIAKLDPAKAQTVPRTADLAALERLLDATNSVTVGTPSSRAYETGPSTGRFTVFRTGNLDPITVRYSVSGTATPGSDYSPLSGTAFLAAGERSIDVSIQPLQDAVTESAETVTITVETDPSYTVGAPASATVSIDDAADVLHVATLRGDGVQRTGGSGYAVLRVTGNQLFADLRLSYTNLKSAALGADLFVSTSGTGGTVVLAEGAGQLTGKRWNFDPAGGLTRAQILQALAEGRLWARVRSSSVPGGEISGRFVVEPGWQTMPAPVAPPPAPTAAANDAEAARFLIQSTFGPRTDEIARVRTLGYAAWLDEQFALPITRHLPLQQARVAQLRARNPNDDGWQGPRHEAWWQNTLTAPDQLRQRMAFALSQIFVISQIGALDGSHEGTTLWYDMLLEESFGNYRNLLQRVTLSPMMGTYLSMMRNRKPNAVSGAEPDENYAREVMQLFSIGLKQLHPDGSLRLDANGMPIDTYSQANIVGLAHVFTGWGPHYDPLNPPRWGDGSVASARDWFYWGWDSLRPMSLYDGEADLEPRTIVGGVTIPSGLTALQRLELALDTLFNHPNTGPFIARQLIQRFVTSNPSPGYVHRVASVFADNGAGVRGDLRATLRAVLLDYEARSPEPAGDVAYGKPREPILVLSALYRTLRLQPVVTNAPSFHLNLQWSLTEQAALQSPSVFNFFQPGYVQPGPIAAAGLVSPEFQIFSETTAINRANLVHSALWWGVWTTESRAPDYTPARLQLQEEIDLLDRAGFTTTQNRDALLDHLGTRLLGRPMSAGLRQQIHDAWNELPSWYTNRRNQVCVAVQLCVTSPEFSVQK